MWKLLKLVFGKNKKPIKKVKKFNIKMFREYMLYRKKRYEIFFKLSKF